MLKLNASSLVLGFVLAGGAAMLMPQGGQPQYVSWGPPKAGVVNIYKVPTEIIPPGGGVDVYTVPSDRWLTLTGVGTYNTGAGVIEVAEDFAGNVTAKGLAVPEGTAAVSGSFAQGSPVGLVFRPGSHVLLVNQIGSPVNFSYSLSGYQTRN